MTYLDGLRVISSLDRSQTRRTKDYVSALGKELFEQYCYMGIIKRGVGVKNGKPEEVCAVTELGRDNIASLSPVLNKRQKRIGNYFNRRCVK